MKLQFVEAGEIVTTHGVRGEVKVLPWLDCPDMLCEFDRCRLDGKVLELHVAEGDMGKVIGRQGRIAKEIRTIIKTVAQRTGEKVTVEIVD